MSKIKVTDDLLLKAYTPMVNKLLQWIGIITLVLIPIFMFTPAKQLLVKHAKIKHVVKEQIVIRDSFFFVGKELKLIQPTKTGNIPSITNNPGCIMKGNPEIDKYAIGVYQVDSRPFLVFPTASHGWKALDDLLTKVYKNKNLIETFKMYCPGTDEYPYMVAKQLNVSVYTKIKDIKNRQKLLNAIATVEGFKKENKEYMKMFIKGSKNYTSL